MADKPVQVNGAPLFFIHLPKTAGTFVRSVLNAKYNRVGAAYPSPPFKPLVSMSQKELANLAASEVVIGHESIHSFRAYFGEGLKFTTILRNPVDRLISYYNHLMTYSERYKFSKVTPLAFIAEDFDYERDNLQLRYLSGKPVTQKVDESDLEKVIASIDQGEIDVGIQELLGQSMSRLAIFKGARPEQYAKLNVSTFGFSRRSFAPVEIEAFRQRSSLDLALYAYCLNRFQSRA